MTRRSFLTAAAAAAATLRADARVESITTISRQPEFYHGWPTLARRRNGELILVYSGGREAHVCPFGRVELMRSRDGGRSWSWPEVLFDSAIDDRDAGAVETPSGALLVTTFTSLAYESVKSKGERWGAVEARTSAEQRKALLDTWMLRSADGGMTWSAAYRVPVNSPHGPAALSDGRLLYVGKQLWTREQKVGACESTDDGKTWRWLSGIPARAGDSAAQYHELHAVQAANGKVIAHIRNHNKANEGETLQTESADGGRTWSEPRSIGVWGLPSHLLRLGDGRLVMSYGYRRAPFGNQARISEDSGATWSAPTAISADGSGGDLGYPSTVEVTPGKLVTVWYESGKGPKAVLRQARWSV